MSKLPRITMGSTVTIKPEYMPAGDEGIKLVAIEDEADGWVKVQAQVDLPIKPVQILKRAEIGSVTVDPLPFTTRFDIAFNANGIVTAAHEAHRIPLDEKLIAGVTVNQGRCQLRVYPRKRSSWGEPKTGWLLGHQMRAVIASNTHPDDSLFWDSPEGLMNLEILRDELGNPKPFVSNEARRRWHEEQMRKAREEVLK